MIRPDSIFCARQNIATDDVETETQDEIEVMGTDFFNVFGFEIRGNAFDYWHYRNFLWGCGAPHPYNRNMAFCLRFEKISMPNPEQNLSVRIMQKLVGKRFVWLRIVTVFYYQRQFYTVVCQHLNGVKLPLLDGVAIDHNAKPNLPVQIHRIK